MPFRYWPNFSKLRKSLSKHFVLPSIELRNLATGKNADLSSQIGKNGARKAIDGNPETHAASTFEPLQWWKLDLGAIYAICRVQLWSPDLACESSLE